MADYAYQSHYCEENIWLLLHQRRSESEAAWAVFISNPNHTCALWCQRASPAPDQPVVWDYHVVAIEQSDDGWRIWDLDTRCDVPTGVDEWWRETFPFEKRVPQTLQPTFRVVERDAFLRSFSSDRSHMRGDDGDWLARPPDWDPIFDPEHGMNLPGFVEMSADSGLPGEILGPDEFRERFAVPPH